MGGGGGERLPPNKIKPCLIFNSIQAYPYSTCRQVEISFLGMPQIAHFQVEKMRKLPTVGDRGRGGDTPLPHLSPARSLRSPRAWSLRSLAKIAPPNVLAHYATDQAYIIIKHTFKKLHSYMYICFYSYICIFCCCILLYLYTGWPPKHGTVDFLGLCS